MELGETRFVIWVLEELNSDKIKNVKKMKGKGRKLNGVGVAPEQR